MPINRYRTMAVAGLGLGLAALAQPAAATTITLPPPMPPVNSLMFGNFFSYSLNFLQFLLSGEVGEVGPGDAFHKTGAPGQITMNDLIIATGAGGPQNNQDIAMGIGSVDDAYKWPTGSTKKNAAPQDFFSTILGTDPTPDAPTLPNDSATTWDVTVDKLQALMNVGAADPYEAVFYFVLNETGDSDELLGNDLQIWARVQLIDDDGVEPTITKFLSAANDPLTIADEHALGLAASILGPTGPDPTSAAADARWARVHGRICVDTALMTFLHFGGCTGADGPNADELNQNLGTNATGFGVFEPMISAELQNAATSYDRLSILLLANFSNNGFETAYFQPTQIDFEGPVIPTPEPASLAAFALGLAGIGAARRKRRS